MKKVAILIETSRAYGRGLLRGISRFNQRNGTWYTYFQPQGLGDAAPPWLKTWKGDGIIARIEDQRLADDIITAAVPTVNLRSQLPGLPFPFIGSDNKLVAETGADHLLSRGYRQFAFCDYKDSPKAFHTRGHHFRRKIKESGFNCTVLSLSGNPRKLKSWELAQQRLAKQISKLPTPAGIMTANDDIGFRVLDACRRLQLRVPDEIGVLGVDNDEFLCDLSVPKLSSININSEETGYLAAEFLDEWMNQGVKPNKIPDVSPLGIATRQSTDVLATKDEAVLAAVDYIKNNSKNNIRVSDIAQHLGISRTTLEIRFKSVLRHTMHQEINRVRIERVKELLADTSLPIKWIAQESGFKSAQYLTRAFRLSTGETPAEFRKKFDNRAMRA